MDKSQNPPLIPIDTMSTVLTQVSGQTSTMVSLDTDTLIAAHQGAAWKISGWQENIAIHHAKGCACCHEYINFMIHLFWLIATRPSPTISHLFVCSDHRMGTLLFASIHKCTFHRYRPSASRIFIATAVSPLLLLETLTTPLKHPCNPQNMSTRSC